MIQHIKNSSHSACSCCFLHAASLFSIEYDGKVEIASRGKQSQKKMIIVDHKITVRQLSVAMTNFFYMIIESASWQGL